MVPYAEHTRDGQHAAQQVDAFDCASQEDQEEVPGDIYLGLFVVTSAGATGGRSLGGAVFAGTTP